MRFTAKLFAVTVSLACLTVSGRTAGRTLVYTTFDFPGATLTSAQGINAGGEVVGLYNDAGAPSRTHGFLLSGGSFSSIDVPNAHATMARGIGPGGDIVGSYQRANESGAVPAHGFLLSNQGTFSAVDFPGHLNTIAQRILPDGTILGCYHDTDTAGSMHGMQMSRGGFDGLSESMSMNNGATPNGKLIVGLFTDMDNKGKAYFLDRGRFEPFEVPGATFTAGWDINPAGVAVGVFRDTAGRFHGFWYDGQSFGSVDVPGATATRVFGINAAGDMAGAYVDTASHTHAFVAQWVDVP
jgi:uncharacterized membrane protein